MQWLQAVDYRGLVRESVELSRTFFEHVSASLNPVRPWMKGYGLPMLRADVIAGLTIAGILIPQSMAQALLVGVPPVYGLYGVLIGASFAALWGSSRYVITAPVAVVSLLTLSALVPLATPGTPEYIALAVILALLVGLIQFLAGILRLGFLARLIPHSVLIGFSIAAGIIIAILQVPNLLGFSAVQTHLMFTTLRDIATHIDDLHLITALLGLAALTLVVGIRRANRNFPIALIILGASILLSAALDLQSLGVATVGAIPAGLPAFFLPNLTLGGALQIIGSALVIATIGFMETYAIGTALGRRNGEHVSANQELVGQGVANVATSVAGGYPVSGSFSASAVNVSAGGRTPVVSIVLSIATLVTLLFLTDYLTYLPRTILAAVVIASVLQLVSVHEILRAYRISATDGFIALATFLIALITKPDTAVIVGIVIALVLFVNRVMWARVEEVCIDPDHNVLLPRDEEHPYERIKDTLIVRPNMSLVYANAEHVIEQIDLILERRLRDGDTIVRVVISFAGVNFADLTGAEAFAEFVGKLRERGIAVATVTMKHPVREVIERALPDRESIQQFGSILEMRRALPLEIPEITT
jgi:SulP family sulfate permease